MVTPKLNFRTAITAIAMLFLSSCAGNLRIPYQSNVSLRISGPASVTAYRCQLYSVSVLDSEGNPAAAAQTISVTLSGLGTGSTYNSLSDCRRNVTSSALFLTQGQSSVDFYFRDTVGGAFNLQASASGMKAGQAETQSVLFQTLGQPDPTSLKSVMYGMGTPYGVFNDGSHLIIADSSNNRVLIWNGYPKPNQQQLADLVLGQNSLSTVNQGTGRSGLNGPVSVYSTGTRLFVLDQGNNRVLIWNTFPTTNNQAADLVLGQPDFNTVTINTGGLSTGLHYPASLTSDGTHLFVSDTSNHRVLIWNALPIASQTPPNLVLGQTDLNSNGSGLGASSLNQPGAVHSDGTSVFVADSKNNRILIWTSFPTTNGQAANRVLGQSTMTTNTQNFGGLSASSLNYPNGVFFDGTRLYATDSNNNRSLIWNTYPATNAPADIVLGQTSAFTNSDVSGPQPTISQRMPGGIYFDGTRLYVNNQSENRIDVWNSVPTATGQPADAVFGQPDLYGMSFNYYPMTKTTLLGPQALAMVNGKLYMADDQLSRVMVWNSIPTRNDTAADLVIGEPDFSSFGVSASATGVFYPVGVSGSGNRLYVADTSNNRVLGWNSAITMNAQSADLVLGQLDKNSRTTYATSASSITFPVSVSYDGTRLYVADHGNNRVMVWNSAPTSDNQLADFVLGQMGTSTSSSSPVSASSMNGPSGVYSDGTRLFVADAGNNRVLIWNTLAGASGQPADIILGQSNVSSFGSGTSATTMRGPTGVFYDGLRLFVADANNNRVLVWDSLPTSTGQAADRVLGQADLNSAVCSSLTATGLCYPQNIVGDGDRVFISDYNNARILILPAF